MPQRMKGPDSASPILEGRIATLVGRIGLLLAALLTGASRLAGAQMPITDAACRAGHVAAWHLAEELRSTVPRPIVTAETVLAIRTLARQRRFASLDSAFGRYQLAAKKDPRNELAWANAVWSFDMPDRTLQEPLDAWVSATGSDAGHTARAMYLAARGGEARGEKWASETSDTAFAEMNRWHRLAWEDLRAALRKDTTNVVVLMRMLDIAVANGDKARSQTAAGTAVAASPTSWMVWASVMYVLGPKYFGSYEAMETVARSTDSLVARNPQLQALHGFVSSEIADSLYDEADDIPGALLAYNRALRYGDSRTFRFGRGRVFYELGRNQQAINDFTCAAAYSPAAGDVLAMRGLARLALAKEAGPALAKSLREQGEADLRLARQLDPYDGTVHWALKHRP